MQKNSLPKNEDMRMNCLACAPGMIFLLVASADGEISKQQLKRFARLMANQDYAILASMLNQAHTTIPELLNNALDKKLDPYQQLESVSHILDVYLSDQAAQVYKIALLKLAKDIAKSPEGLFGLFEGKITRNERKAIAIVASLLGLLDVATKEPSDSDDVHLKSSIYSDNSSTVELPDTVLPVLQSANWANSTDTDVMSKSIYQHDELAQNEPVIAYANELPNTTLELLSSSTVKAALTIEQIHQKAVHNLERRLVGRVSWNHLNFESGIDEIGCVAGLVLNGDYYCSEAILSETLLKQAHQQLNSNLLMAIAPVRGELYVTNLVSEHQPEPQRIMFAHFASSRYFNPQQVQISPNVWVIRNGIIAGHVAGMDQIIETAKQSAIPANLMNDKLIHTVKTYSEEQGIGIEIDIIAKDIEIMMSNLQHLIRSYVDLSIQQKTFTGKLRVLLDIQDPKYNAGMKESILEQLASMSDFMCHQFSSTGIKTANNANIKLTCSVIN
jgi:hypothetical protein